ncbi:hypothetical protein L873DRAFT_1820309, partial [Choiromyces venosus 120613-1]
MNEVYLYPQVMTLRNNGAKIYSWNSEERYNSRLSRAKHLPIVPVVREFKYLDKF